MHVISRKRILEFGDKHPDSISALDHWYRLAKHNDITSFYELRRIYPSADKVGRLVVFDVGGNKVRLIAYIVYQEKRIYIRHILTHEEYNKEKWKKEA